MDKPTYWYYVCDTCGTFEPRSDQVPEDGEWTCVTCHSHAAWEFPPDRLEGAMDHARAIADARRTGIFQRRA